MQWILWERCWHFTCPLLCKPCEVKVVVNSNLSARSPPKMTSLTTKRMWFSIKFVFWHCYLWKIFQNALLLLNYRHCVENFLLKMRKNEIFFAVKLAIFFSNHDRERTVYNNYLCAMYVTYEFKKKCGAAVRVLYGVKLWIGYSERLLKLCQYSSEVMGKVWRSILKLKM